MLIIKNKHKHDAIISKLLKLYGLQRTEGEGFEPPEGCPSTVFKTAAIDRSAIPPVRIAKSRGEYEESIAV